VLKEILMSCIVAGFVQSAGIRVLFIAANTSQFWFLILVSKLLRTLRQGGFPSGFIELLMS
jgi:hypothetical protein